jgi:hypothetical protein
MTFVRLTIWEVGRFIGFGRFGLAAWRFRSRSFGHPGIGFRGSMAGLCPPLPTLRRRPYGRQRTARGRCGYSFIVVDLHHLLLAGLPAHFESYMASHAVGLRKCSPRGGVTKTA